MSTVNSNLPEILSRAVAVLDLRGWCQGDFCGDEQAPQSPVCLVGAINVASGSAPWDVSGARRAGAERAYFAVLESLDLLPCESEDGELPAIEDAVSLLAQWADASGRTASDVIETLRTAALAA